ncbi:MAG: DUF2130 domain-containing protein, partial [Patescibacteria group bacterium]|nr:DUF2130 domain-containing protein [Patescibacteria group bacterium]
VETRHQKELEEVKRKAIEETEKEIKEITSKELEAKNKEIELVKEQAEKEAREKSLKELVEQKNEIEKFKQIAQKATEKEKELNVKIQKQVDEKNELIEQTKKETKEEVLGELKEKNEQIEALKLRTKSAEANEANLRKEKRQLEEDKEKFEVEKQRQLDQERDTIKKQAIQSVEEKDRFKFAEYEKQLADMKKAVDEAQRKSNLGSQQLQGEVLELDFEELLKNTFPNDQIEPVEKGVKGADVRQTVLSPKGINCGVILWETKRTKVWADKWLDKLKQDLRAEKANIPVIVSTVMPKEFKTHLGLKNGVWVVSFELAVSLAHLLRKNLLDVGYQMAVSIHKEEKAENLYGYITSHEFRQQVEAMVETYFQMKNQITKERAAYEKMWQSREKQADKLFKSTANIVGNIQGEIGQGTFQIKGLELLELESG